MAATPPSIPRGSNHERHRFASLFQAIEDVNGSRVELFPGLEYPAIFAKRSSPFSHLVISAFFHINNRRQFI
jgi:hypothetical protein